MLGTIAMEDYERENAYGEAEVRLLSTVAASMGVALENARLFDETQRLFKETEQRAAELAIINSIQEGMAAKLDFQAIIDLVGDKLREVFTAGVVGIRWYDPQGQPDSLRVSSTNTASACSPAATAPSPGGPWSSRCVRPRQPLVDQHRAEMVALGIEQ